MFYEGCTLEEIRAFRELEKEVFDFGEGDMKIEGWYGSEDAYYEMCLPEECRYNIKTPSPLYSKSKSKTNKKYRPNHHARKQVEKKKLDKLYNTSAWWAVIDKNTHKKRNYILNGKYCRKYSNRCVRRYRKEIGNGGNYRKLYDYWWEVL